MMLNEYNLREDKEMKKIYLLTLAIAILISNYMLPILAQTSHEIRVHDVNDTLTVNRLEKEPKEEGIDLRGQGTVGEQMTKKESIDSNPENEMTKDYDERQEILEELFIYNDERSQLGISYDEADPNEEYLLFEIFIEDQPNYNFITLVLSSVPTYFKVTNAFIMNASGTYNMAFQNRNGNIEFNSPTSLVNQGGTVKVYGKLDSTNYKNYIDEGNLGRNIVVNYTITYEDKEEWCAWLPSRIWLCYYPTITTRDHALAPTFKLHEVMSLHETAGGETLFPEKIFYGLLGANYKVEPEKSDSWIHVDTLGEAAGIFSRESVEVKFIYELNLIVAVKDQEVALGTDISLREPKSFIESVTLGDEVLTSQDYDVTFKNINVNTGRIGYNPNGIELELMLRASNLTTTVTVPVEVIWGSTLQIGSNNRWMVTGLSLVQELNDWKIYGTEGEGLLQNAIHPSWSTQDYLGLSLFSSNDTFVIDEVQPYYEDSWRGEEQRSAVNERFSSQSVNLGDVLKVWHAELDVSEMIRVHHDGKNTPVTLREETKSLYFELTKTGYRELMFDQVGIRGGTIFTDTTEAELDNQISDYLDLSQTSTVEIVGFIDYPDRSQSGMSTGIIRVQEELQSTRTMVQKDYEVTFEVERSESLSFLDVPNELKFKTTTIQSQMTIIGREDPDWALSIEDTRSDGEPWSLMVTANPLRSDKTGHEIEGAIIFKKEDEIYHLSSTSSTLVIENSEMEIKVTEVSWNHDEGLLLQMRPGEARATTYTTTITWTLQTGPPNVLDVE